MNILDKWHVLAQLQANFEKNRVKVGAHHHGLRFIQVLCLHAFLIYILLVHQVVIVPLQLRARTELIVAPDHNVLRKAEADFPQIYFEDSIRPLSFTYHKLRAAPKKHYIFDIFFNLGARKLWVEVLDVAAGDWTDVKAQIMFPLSILIIGAFVICMRIF